jgi:all-trans-8'-apo-beta-carotenal 15,15'-oxygenase
MTNPAIIDRRRFLSGAMASIAAAAVITPERALAGAAPAGWSLGVADVEADIPLETLTRMHGQMPRGFSGTLYRNGPAKFRRGTSESGHWFDGDGLIRRFHLADGQATLNARFADTAKRRLETHLNAIVQPGFGTAVREGSRVSGPDDCNSANTGVMMGGADLMALWEGGSPVRMDPVTLETLGLKTYRRDLAHMPFSAHPRIEPDGSSWNFGGGGSRAAIWRVDAAGALVAMTMIDLPRRSYFHDFTMTARHIIIVLQPWLQEPGLVFPISTGLAWRPELGTQILVLDKDDLTQRRVFDLPAFAFFHLGDGWEETDGTIRFDGCLEADPTFGQRSASAMLRGEHVRSPQPVLTQIVLRNDGRAELHSSGRAAEFPQSDPRRAGLLRDRTVHVTHYRETPFPHAIARWDWRSGRADTHDFGDNHLVEEFVFVADGAGESDGWLVGTTLNLRHRATELHVINARRIADGPVVSFRASMPLPLGFHGRWVG